MSTIPFSTPTPQPPAQPQISCAGGCTKKRTEQEAEQEGWERLPITGRMRCGQCGRELKEAGRTKD